MNSKNRFDWIDTITKIAGALGFNSVRVRWKLMRWRKSTKHKGQGAVDTISHVGYEHRICPNCGRLQDGSHKICTNCGASLTPRFLEILNRIGLVTPHLVSVSSIVLVAIVGCYLRTVSANGSLGFINIDWQVLLAFGANYPPSILAGEWWRLGTCIFLHADLMHLLFNLFALAQIGPEIEEILGRARFLFFFMLTGIVAALWSLVWRHYVTGVEGIGIGASGAIMGLVGLAAGWGQRDGTSIGRSIRNMMLKWGAYTVVFGFFLGADNAAHMAGFLFGGLLGFFALPRTRKRSAIISGVFALIGVLLVIGSIIIVQLY